ncbi:MOSC domain-containing protein [Nocardiopsis sp. CNT312]|uniref:MOSC domain-containing protein n=1 Tax=Nocardiopsis sp. CNT312 TaxID=1137268 RepID=UPI00048F7050|nr:MOSC domain-containing protein [Nocardiopsis sp. CNT312]
MAARVVSVSAGPAHTFSKPVLARVRLLAGLGVEGDAHMGATVQHRSRVARDPSQPNLRQVHLIHAELLDAVAGAGFDVAPGQMGENITTRGIDLLGLAAGTVLHLGDEARVEITGLRNPCRQIDGFSPGLLRQMVRRGGDGSTAYLAGVMGIVLTGGTVAPGAAVGVHPPRGPHLPLRRV